MDATGKVAMQQFDLGILEGGLANLVSSGRDNGPREPHQSCDVCDEPLPCSVFCLTCSKYLCDGCLEKHQRMRITKAHTQTAMSEWVMCPHDQVAQFYCRDDQVFACLVCASEDHPECDLAELDDPQLRVDAAKSVQDKLDRFTSPIPNKDTFEAELDEASEGLYAAYGEAESHLEKARLSFEAAVRAKQREVKERLAREKGKLEAHRDNHRRLCSIAETLTGHADAVKGEGRTVDVLFLAENMPNLPANYLVEPARNTPQCVESGDLSAHVQHLLSFNNTETADVSRTAPTLFGEKAAVAATPLSIPALTPAGTYVLKSPTEPPAKTARKATNTTTSPPELLWQVKTGVDVDDVVYDPNNQAMTSVEADAKAGEPGVWWVRAWDEDTKLWRYTLAGVLEGKLGGGSLINNNCRLTVAPAGQDWALVTTDKTGVVWLDAAGNRVAGLDIPGAGALHGVAYCPGSGVYVVTDCGKACLWYVRRTGEGGAGEAQWKEWAPVSTLSAGELLASGGEPGGYDIRRVSGGGGDQRIKWPSFITQHKSHFVVSDNGDNAIKIFSATGDLTNRLGCEGYTEDLVSYPCGVAVDSDGWVVVCDSGHKQVVRYSWNGDACMVLLSTDDLVGGEPYCVALGPNRTILVALDGGSLMCFKLPADDH